ncbi:receptor-type tyrosine-protein phosphatase F-like [Amphiura filiformis]|uniref:receptor-type tyrosine-protein phosphatase F-like n=1 Tax=Amphiura filiformis TaxID=82378 RepID=UPI003B226ED9
MDLCIQCTTVMIFVILHGFVLRASGAVYKSLDVITVDPSPLVGSDSSEEYRAYVRYSQTNAKFDEIGRYEDTGTGEVGNGHEIPESGNSTVLPESGLPINTKTYIQLNVDVSKQLKVVFPATSDTERIGIFYSNVTRGKVTHTMTTIKMSETACPPGRYGANCDRECHCNVKDCDAANGCINGNTCDKDYGAHFCQGKNVCDNGFFGEQCQYHCHCYEGAACDKITGTCSNGCAEGWAGSADCQQALPILYNAPTIVQVVGVNIELDWDDWDQMVDYGNGPVIGYSVYYGIDGNLNDMKNVTVSNVSVASLQPDAKYGFSIAVVKNVDGKAAEGVKGEVVYATTYCLAPTKHPNFTDVVAISSSSVRLKWEIPDGHEWQQCSSLDGFTIRYQDLNTSKTIQIPLTNSSTTITSLQPCKEYEFQIQARNKDADGILSPPVSVSTLTVPPGKVESLDTKTSAPGVITIEWTKPNKSQCITSYVVGYNLTLLDQCLEMDEYTETEVNETSVDLIGVEYYSTYVISVWARSGNESGPLEYECIMTEETAPSGKPESVTVESLADLQLSYNWDPLNCTERGGEITYEYRFTHNIVKGIFTFGSTKETYVTFSKLSYYTWYEFQVRANTSQGAGPFTDTIRYRTQEGAPDQPQNVEILSVFTNEIEIQWDSPGAVNGELTRYVLEVSNVVFENKTSIEISDDLTRQTIKMNVAYLMAETEYSFKVKAVTNGGEGPWSQTKSASTLPHETGGLNDTTTLVIAVTSSLVLAVIVILLVTVVLRKRRLHRNKTDLEMEKKRLTIVKIDENEESNPSVIADLDMDTPSGQSTDAAKEPIERTSSMTSQQTKPEVNSKPIIAIKPTSRTEHEPVLVADLFEYVKRKKRNIPDDEFSRDFETLPSSNASSADASKQKENLPKNRYKNIITYDHSRVILEELDGKPNSDYINASYIDGYEKDKAYIAAQGPKPKTIDDMWRMIWQENSRTVVMATSLVEGGKVLWIPSEYSF